MHLVAPVSRPKHVRLWFGAGCPNQNTCACGLVLGVPTKTRAPVVWCWVSQPKHVRLWFGAGCPTQTTSRVQRTKDLLNRFLFISVYFCLFLFMIDSAGLCRSCVPARAGCWGRTMPWQGPTYGKAVAWCTGTVPTRSSSTLTYSTTTHLCTPFSISNIAPLLFKMACKQNLDLRCVLISDPGTLGAGAKTRLESRIKKFTPHCIYRYCEYSGAKGQTVTNHKQNGATSGFEMCVCLCCFAKILIRDLICYPILAPLVLGAKCVWTPP